MPGVIAEVNVVLKLNSLGIKRMNRGREGSLELWSTLYSRHRNCGYW